MLHILYLKVVSLILLPITFLSGFIVGPQKPFIPESTKLDIYHLEQSVKRLDYRVKDIENKPVVSPKTVALGATLPIPTAVAFFETSLQGSISSSATSMTLVSALDKTGTALASSTYAFVIDEGTSVEENVVADCTATACTNMTRGLSPITGTTTVSALQSAHRRGASVKITNAPYLLILNRIINGQGTIPNALSYTSHPTFTTGTQIVDKTYADGLSYAGVATSTESSFGGVWLATQLQQASSTNGAPNAPYVLQSKYATSTPSGTSTSGLYTVISKNNGKIHQLWLDLTEAFTWSGAHTFNTATTTFNATTSIAATSASPIRLNGVNYNFPSTNGASSTVMTTNGSGTVTWARTTGTKLFSTFAGYSTSDDTNENTIFTTTFTGGLLSTTGLIRVRIPVSSTPDGSAAITYAIRLKYGGSTLSTLTATGPAVGGGNAVNGTGYIEAIINNNASLSSQFVGFYGFLGHGSSAANQITSSINFASDTTSSIDTSTDQTLSMTIQRTGSGHTPFTFARGIIEYQ